MINNLNSALHLTQTYYIPPERIAAARGRSGISDYKNIFNAILLLKWLFSCIFRSIAFYILLIFAIKWVGLGLGVRLRGLKI